MYKRKESFKGNQWLVTCRACDVHVTYRVANIDDCSGRWEWTPLSYKMSSMHWCKTRKTMKYLTKGIFPQRIQQDSWKVCLKSTVSSDYWKSVNSRSGSSRQLELSNRISWSIRHLQERSQALVLSDRSDNEQTPWLNNIRSSRGNRRRDVRPRFWRPRSLFNT